MSSLEDESLDMEEETELLTPAVEATRGAQRQLHLPWPKFFKYGAGLLLVVLAYAGGQSWKDWRDDLEVPRAPQSVKPSPRPQQKYSGLNGGSGPMPKVPGKATEHNGIEWPAMVLHGSETMTFLIIGDWGGMDGAIQPPNGGSRMVQYNGGMAAGPHVFAHRPSGCTDGEMSICFNARGGNGCKPNCGYNDTVDYQPGLLVAKQMKKRAAVSKPKFVLNVGDNFYWGGVPLQCGTTPVSGVHWITGHMFDTIYQQVYNTEDLNIAWLSVLGNHDYGGWMYSAAWDQQIAYTWHNAKWRLPGQYWMQHVEFPDKGFDMDILLLDSNSEDARPASLLQDTNLCSVQHNNNANCASIGGPASPADCPVYFANLWQEQIKWTEEKLKKSKARWQVIVTHFPCGHQGPWYEKLHKELGLDLVVTGHTHVQLTSPIGGLMCVISGGGGGILSEAPSHGDDSNSYGFYEATVDKDYLQLELINFAGRSLGKWHLNWEKDAPTSHKVVHEGHMTVPKRLKKGDKGEKGDKSDAKDKDEKKDDKTPAHDPPKKEKCGFWCKLLH